MSEEKLLTVSWSRLKTWLDCKQRAQLQSQGVKSPAADMRVFFRGTVVDRVLRQWLQNENRQPGQMPGMVDEYIELCEREHREQGTGIVRWKHATDKEESAAWCKELLVRLEPIMEDLVLPYVLHVEADKRLKVKITIPGLYGEPREIQLNGILDILIDHPDFTTVYDLKATENEHYWKKTIAQLVFYYVMLDALGKTPKVMALIQPMCQNQIIPMTVTSQDVMSLMTHIVNYAHSVWLEDFTPKASDAGCSWCSVKHACVKFKLSEDGRVSWM